MKHHLRTTCALVALALALTALPALAGDAGKVNINSAGTAELALLPRVGPAVAQRIVEFREENGGFKALEDLMLVRGIGEKTFDLIEPYATLSGETTLTEKVRVGRSRPQAADSDQAGSR